MTYRVVGCRRKTLSILLATTPVAAFAQTAATPVASGEATEGLSEIVVTATRRAANVQNVPIAITAITGNSLRDRGIVDPQQLSSLAPSLHVDQGQGNGNTHVSLRGLASTELGVGPSSPVGIYVDDVYQPFQFGLGTQIFDLNRIEVLRGPQGTLFGKNTTGGALLYYSQAPVHRDEGYLNLEAGGGDYDHFVGEGALNKTLSDTLAMRASFRADYRGDAYKLLNANSSEGKSIGHFLSLNGRLQFNWHPSDETTVNLRFSGIRANGDNNAYVGKLYPGACASEYAAYFCDGNDNPLPAPANSRQTYSLGPVFERYFNYGSTLRVDQNFGDYLLTSVTGVQAGGYSSLDNGQGLAGDFFHARFKFRSRQVSQELRLATPVAKPLHAVVGLFGMYDKINISQGFGSVYNPPIPYYLVNAVHQGTTSLAAFGSATYELTDKLSVVGGARYSYDRKKINTPLIAYNANFFNPDPARVLTNDYLIYNYANSHFDPNYDVLLSNADTKSWRRFTWDATLNYKPSKDVLVYAKYSTGYRAGGFPMGLTSVQTEFRAVAPENVKAYELGFKSEFLDRKLRVNLAAYRTDYTNMQTQTQNTNGAGLTFGNAGKAVIKGFEAEVEVLPTRGLHLSGSFGYNDAKYKKYLATQAGAAGITQTSLDGNRLPYAPQWTSDLAVDYNFAVNGGIITLGTDWNYRSKIYFDPFDVDPASDGPRWLGNLRATYEANKHWSVTAYVNNVTNRDVKNYSYYLQSASGAFVTSSANYGPRRTFGLRLGYKW